MKETDVKGMRGDNVKAFHPDKTQCVWCTAVHSVCSALQANLVYLSTYVQICVCLCVNMCVFST